jgi:formylmethanofuran dehydrogenase subunit D
VNPNDAVHFGLKDGAPVSLSTVQGEIILNWRAQEGLPQGLVFVPYGIWANQILGCDTRCTGTPQFKGVKARISSAEEKHVPNLSEIVAALKEGT